MDHDFWKERWSEGRIGFHEGKPNHFLAQHHGVFGEARHVFVPLCGKAEDVAYLASLGHRVVGVELVEDAVRAFFDEHEIKPSIRTIGDHTIYGAGSIMLIAGDFFTLPPILGSALDALYDRAALVALPPEMRGAYARQVRTLVPPGSPGLVVTLEYRPGQFDGPPFSVLEDELRRHYGEPRLLGEAPYERIPGATERCWSVTL